MPEEFFLRSFVGQAIPIDIDEAAALNLALDSTFAQIAFEELWDAAVQNFVDLERDVLYHAVDNMMFGHHDWNHFQDMRTLFARRLSNLLSACRAYIDLAPRQFRLIGQPSLSDAFKQMRSNAYDNHFSYRLMEALRNYTQHYGSPITGTHLDTRRVEQPAGDQLRYVTAASINSETLTNDPKLKASVRRELTGMGKLEVNQHARSYIEQLGGVHVAVRTIAISDSGPTRMLVSSAIERIKAIGGESDFGAYLISKVSGEEQSRRALMMEPFDRLDILRLRNGSLQGLSSRYVSGELLGEKLR